MGLFKIPRKGFVLLLIPLIILSFTLYSNRERSKGRTTGFVSDRKAMVELLKEFGIKDKKILAAFNRIKRHLFIPGKFRERCNPYGNHPCPIGFGQTISQPYMVAYMTERLGLIKGEKVLEIGTGSGYQAAILAEIGADVTSLEIVRELSEHAAEVLKEQGYGKVKVVNSSGYLGYPAAAPYDAIIITCAPEKIPENLIKELREGGRMILPVGKYFQKLIFLTKINGKIRISEEMNVRFVPMIR